MDMVSSNFQALSGCGLGEGLFVGFAEGDGVAEGEGVAVWGVAGDEDPGVVLGCLAQGVFGVGEHVVEAGGVCDQDFELVGGVGRHGGWLSLSG